MLQQLSLSRKLAAMVVVPVVALIFFATADVLRRLETRNEMSALADLTRVAMDANRLAGTLHNERSLTAGSLTAEDTGTADLEAAYRATDDAVAALTENVAGLDPDITGEVMAEDLQNAVSSLGVLISHRQEVASGDLSAASAVSTYNQLTRELLPVVGQVAKRSSNTEIRSMLNSLDLLAQIKEGADLERAALNVAFTADQISPGIFQAVVEMISRQETLEKIFLGSAPEDVVGPYLDTVQGDAFEEVSSMRLDAIDGVGMESLGVNPRRWWRASSVRIDAMTTVEADLANLAIDRVEHLRSSAARAAAFGSLTALIAVLGAIALSAWVGRGVNSSLASATDTIREAVSQISTSVQQLTASTGETAAAVTQTSTTVGELRQTSEAAAKKAEATAESAEESRGASETARHAAERGVSAMQSIRGEVEGIAERIVELSERSAQISDIVQNVNAIAEQSNLLAVNASIEAAKAGEHGRGFAVVASEVKTLAERSKEATEEIRGILAEIQRSSNSAVMVTEQGVKRVDEGNNVIAELGQGVSELVVTIQESADASNQITLISNQQLAGIQQITEALRSVEQAAADNAAGAQQLEKAASDLASVSRRITRIVEGVDTAADGS